MDISLLQAVCPSAPVDRLSATLPGMNAAIADADLSTPYRLAMFLAQTAEETDQFSRFVENMSYSAERIVQVWPARFPALALAAPYAHNPAKLGSRVYADRMGNGDEQSGDGFKYRGRGALQMTGAESYRVCGNWFGVDLMALPELAEKGATAFRVGAWVWRTKGLNKYADAGDLGTCTRKINGGLLGFETRSANYARALKALGVAA
jgi:putative chitinase